MLDSGSSHPLEPQAARRIRSHRHLLGDDADVGPEAVVRRVCGLQAQVAGTPAIALLARVRAGAEAVRDALAGPELVLTWAMRGTLHLVHRDDLRWYAAAVGGRVAAQETRLWPKHGVRADDEDRVNDGILRALADGPLERSELASRVGDDLGAEVGELLRHSWGIGLKPVVARGLVELRSRGRNMRLSLPARTTGAVDEQEARQWLAERYLWANAIADVPSFARWSGLTRSQARKSLDATADTTVHMRGSNWYGAGDLTDPGPSDRVSLLPVFDPFTLAAADRDGFWPAEPSAIWRKGGWVSAVIVRDGRALGTWKHTRTKKRIQLSYSWREEEDRSARASLDAAEADVIAMLNQDG